MDNHAYLILVSSEVVSRRAALDETHRRNTRMVNFREGWRRQLFQRRFASCPMDKAQPVAAVRYVEQLGRSKYSPRC